MDDPSNEITALPALLEVLALKGCIVTLDAMGCQKAIAHTIVEAGADYVLAVKENQPQLYSELEELFAHAQTVRFRDGQHAFHQAVNKGHGRIETRRCWTIADPTSFAYLRDRDKWPRLRTLVMVVTERRVGDTTSRQSRYFISSLPTDAHGLLAAVRNHWGIENQLHWVLDIAFREDDSRVRKDHAPHNFAILRHVALNLLKQERSAKCGTKAKRLKAAWDHDYLLKVLAA